MQVLSHSLIAERIVIGMCSDAIHMFPPIESMLFSFFGRHSNGEPSHINKYFGVIMAHLHEHEQFLNVAPMIFEKNASLNHFSSQRSYR